MTASQEQRTTVFSRRPALRFALLLCVGILFGRYVQPDAAAVFVVAAALFVSGVILAYRFSQLGIHGAVLALVVVSLGVCLQLFQRDDFTAKKLIPVEEREQVVFEGKIVEEPSIKQNRVQFVLSLERLSRAGVLQSIERRVLVYGKPAVYGEMLENVKFGAVVYGRGVIDDYPQQRNPGEFDYGRYLELNGVHGVVAVRDTGILRVTEGGAGSWRVLPGRLRSHLLNQVDSLHSEQAAAFLRGILLADRSKLPDEVRQSFVETGTIHVLAVSGLHVGVIAIVFYGVFGLIRLPRRLIVFCTIAGLFFYMLLVGAPPSVVRATIMAIVILIGLI
ncbi:MAG: competence protein ComEC family protein, partial [Nitrososphaera sp.]|nr:competence protein ComEC family protein [Nitrososphaera sp.]